MQEPSRETMIKVVKQHFNFRIDDNAYSNYDIAAYTESTADGYEVYVVTNDMQSISINEDVYYYETSWFEKLADYLRDGAQIYIDQYSQEGYEYEEVIENMYDELYMEVHGEIVDELEEEGYEYPESE